MDIPTDGEPALRQLSDSDLRDVLREISVQSYIRGSLDRIMHSETGEQFQIAIEENLEA